MNTPELSCEEVIERLFEFLDRELDDVSQEEIDRHLKRCYDCFSRAEFERRLRERIAATGSQKAPERLKKRIRELTE
ncbi:mycothiol system anti-sigma-R factor [Marinobacter guineae]|uniref:Mycothiol system anti-sigma-R factor n=1 Tax=Marinobacter guineae TaxID=432303 RepID=A0A2G1VC70_9GAMM|nr:zf-HC2 domain-containing protein [Marinobacter guineae]PHQ24383.1 mycothiol system anti-sigma-R factor [Marinobacter guineae]